MNRNHTILLLIAAAYLIDVIFDLVPGDAERYSFFPFFHGYGQWDGKMTLQNYVYGYCQHAFLIMIFHAVYVHTGRKFWEWLMWLEVVDVIDYALHYNHTLFSLFGHSIEFNYFKFMAVLYLSHREYATSS
jgi:hypothetical protein